MMPAIPAIIDTASMSHHYQQWRGPLDRKLIAHPAMTVDAAVRVAGIYIFTGIRLAATAAAPFLRQALSNRAERVRQNAFQQRARPPGQSSSQ